MVEIIEKGWGREIIFASNKDYCGKLMIYDKANSKSSMHYHMVKHETWYVQKGLFKVTCIDTSNASQSDRILTEGDTWVNPPGFPHQLEALEENSIIFEVSTEDNVDDNYRVFPGDSQR